MTCQLTIETIPCDRCHSLGPREVVQFVCPGCGRSLCQECFGDVGLDWCKECLEKEKAAIAKSVRKES